MGLKNVKKNISLMLFLKKEKCVKKKTRVLLRGKNQNIGKYRYIGTWILWIYRKYR